MFVCLFWLAKNLLKSIVGKNEYLSISFHLFKVFKYLKRKSSCKLKNFKIVTSRMVYILLCCSVTQSCPTLYDHMDCRTPNFLVLAHLLELAQTHVHRVGDAIEPSHPLSSPSPLPFNLFQHQGLF